MALNLRHHAYEHFRSLSQAFKGAAQAMQGKFQAMNQEFFDDAKGGALLLRLGRESRESIQRASDWLDRADQRAEMAIEFRQPPPQ